MKTIKSKTFKCACGKKLNYEPSELQSKDRRVCPKCHKLNYVADNIDWCKVAGGQAHV